MKYSFLAEAEAEYLEAIEFFEARSAGLGSKLIAEFEHHMELVAERPTSWKRVHSRGIYRKDLRKFPFAIFYRMIDELPQITAFSHHRRAPNYWHHRVDG